MSGREFALTWTAIVFFVAAGIASIAIATTAIATGNHLRELQSCVQSGGSYLKVPNAGGKFECRQ